MKVILIEEDRFKEICDKLRAETDKLVANESDLRRKAGMESNHRNMYYHLVSWMQSHGASCV